MTETNVDVFSSLVSTQKMTFIASSRKQNSSISFASLMLPVTNCLKEVVSIYLSLTDSCRNSMCTLQVLSRFSGIFYLMAANVIFTCYTFAFKTMPLDIANTMVIRQAVQAFIFGTYARYYKQYKLFEHNEHKFAAILNVLTSSGTNISYMTALYFLPLSTLNAIKHTYMIWAAILPTWFLRDKFSPTIFCSVLLAVAGLTLTTKPDVLVSNLNRAFTLIIDEHNDKLQYIE